MRIKHFDRIPGSRSCSSVLMISAVLILQIGCASVSNSGGKTRELGGGAELPANVTGEADSPGEAEGTSATQLASLGAATPDVIEGSLAPLDLRICKTQVSNAPLAVDRQVSRPSASGCLNGVPLLIAPAPGACLTSGFGQRGNRLHKGLDFQSKPAGEVVAAAPGEVLTSGFREKDFGNWIVVDHGSDVYTSYSHLASVDPGISEGTQVSQGQVLGVMGQSGPDWIRAIHLHYEVRVGKLSDSYFQLEPVDAFDLPGSCAPS